MKNEKNVYETPDLKITMLGTHADFLLSSGENPSEKYGSDPFGTPFGNQF